MYNCASCERPMLPADLYLCFEEHEIGICLCLPCLNAHGQEHETPERGN